MNCNPWPESVKCHVDQQHFVIWPSSAEFSRCAVYGGRQAAQTRTDGAPCKETRVQAFLRCWLSVSHLQSYPRFAMRLFVLQPYHQEMWGNATKFVQLIRLVPDWNVNFSSSLTNIFGKESIYLQTLRRSNAVDCPEHPFLRSSFPVFKASDSRTSLSWLKLAPGSAARFNETTAPASFCRHVGLMHRPLAHRRLEPEWLRMTWSILTPESRKTQSA